MWKQLLRNGPSPARHVAHVRSTATCSGSEYRRSQSSVRLFLPSFLSPEVLLPSGTPEELATAGMVAYENELEQGDEQR